MNNKLLISKIKELVEIYYDEIINTRRYLHQNPELSFEEYNTSKYIQAILEKHNVKFIKDIAKTGVKSIIDSKKIGKTIALRADMDALPILEETNLDYASNSKGLMHACGHDFHMTTVLYSTIILNQLQEYYNGKIVSIFQPSEEKLPSGAEMMINEGVLENPTVDFIIGCHVLPELETGKIGFRKGMYMAACDELYITVNGLGGHGAMPHKAIDPILISSHIIIALQQIVSRNADYKNPTVLTIGYIEGKGQTNIIPQKVDIKGTLRTHNEQWRFEAHKLIESICTGIANSMGASAVVEIKVGLPSLQNNAEITDLSIRYAKEILGDENVNEIDFRMGGDDFAFYSQRIPSFYYRIGVNSEFNLHHPKFNIDEKSIFNSVLFMVYQTIKHLE